MAEVKQLDLAAALRVTAEVQVVSGLPSDLGNVVFTGAGDSLAASLLAGGYGYRAVSSGDIAWTGSVPARCNTVVGVSHSGETGATVRALRVARVSGCRTIAVTTKSASALAGEADVVVQVPAVDAAERVPAAGYVALGLGVLQTCGAPVNALLVQVAGQLDLIASSATAAAELLPRVAPAGISVLSLPQLRSPADLWSLKLMEATGVATRATPLEESGHVDYFIGPQPHLVIQLIGAEGRERHARLGEALESNGHLRIDVNLGELSANPETGELTPAATLAAAAVGAPFAEAAALAWNRPLFRGGAVAMHGNHIKLTD